MLHQPNMCLSDDLRMRLNINYIRGAFRNTWDFVSVWTFPTSDVYVGHVSYAYLHTWLDFNTLCRKYVLSCLTRASSLEKKKKIL